MQAKLLAGMETVNSVCTWDNAATTLSTITLLGKITELLHINFIPKNLLILWHVYVSRTESGVRVAATTH